MIWCVFLVLCLCLVGFVPTSIVDFLNFADVLMVGAPFQSVSNKKNTKATKQPKPKPKHQNQNPRDQKTTKTRTLLRDQTTKTQTPTTGKQRLLRQLQEGEVEEAHGVRPDEEEVDLGFGLKQMLKGVE